LLISFPALAAGAGTIALLFGVKMVTKAVTVWPTAAAFGMSSRDRTYTTLLMATGLTFGSIAALYGLTNDLITQRQYSVLLTVVILSAFVPTLIAQQWFEPELEGLDDELEEGAGEEDLTMLHRRHPRPGRTQPGTVGEEQEQERRRP
jgi:Kef-type K+ transport system membrane component KefB